ncbi:slipin family protein [Amylibacter sp.]|nr:slipin family protein [Amylibacter sp.]
MMRMKEIIERLMGNTHLTVTENHRVLVMRYGSFVDILSAGRHAVKWRETLFTWYELADGRFVSEHEKALYRSNPALANAHLTQVSATDTEVVVVSREGRVAHVVMPGTRAVLWTDAGPWALDRIDISGDLAMKRTLAMRLMQAGKTLALTAFKVDTGTLGLLSVDGAFDRTLDAGSHWFWKVGRVVTLKLVDMRHCTHEVTGQEILARDRVTVRVNLSAQYRVTDAVLATTKTPDFVEALHRSLQLAFRKSLGSKTLDELLGDKAAVNIEAAAEVRTQMADLGLEVGEIALKDVILPGEMRDIMNTVVAAQKEAEANVIRRREETNATRSLLNTAKVMSENPVMLRLKELEALEVVAGKVDKLTVHNGTQGLMTDLVKLTD